MKQFLTLSTIAFLLSFLSFGNGLARMTNHASVRVFRLHRREYLVASAGSRVIQTSQASQLKRAGVSRAPILHQLIKSWHRNVRALVCFCLPVQSESLPPLSDILNLYTWASDPPLLPPPKA